MNQSKEKSIFELDSRSKLQLPSTSHVIDKQILSETCHQCSVCSKTHLTANALKRHVQEQHEGKKNEFKCDECHNKTFTTGLILWRHQAVHSGNW